MLFNGAAIGEAFDISANGGRVRFTRNVANINMDLNDVERVEVNALGGADSVNMRDLRGTEVRNVRVDLAATVGGDVGDNVGDTVTVSGSSQGERVTVTASGDDILVNGFASATRIANTDALDRIVVNGGNGSDLIDAAVACGRRRQRDA